MANKKITDLQLISSITDTVNFAGDDTIQTYRATALQFYNYLKSKGMVDAYQSGTTYANGDYTTYNGVIYKSIDSSNTGNTPNSSPTKWIAIDRLVDLGYIGSAPEVGGSSPFQMVYTDAHTCVITPSSANIVIKLPTTGVKSGERLKICNGSVNYKITIQSSDATQIAILDSKFASCEFIALQDTPTTYSLSGTSHWLPIFSFTRYTYTMGGSGYRGTAPTITISARSPSGAGGAVTPNLTSFIPIQDIDGNWYLDFRWNVSVPSVGATTAIKFAVSGIVSDAAEDQNFLSVANNATGNDRFFVQKDTNTFEHTHSGSTTSAYTGWGLIKLKQKPDFAS